MKEALEKLEKSILDKVALQAKVAEEGSKEKAAEYTKAIEKEINEFKGLSKTQQEQLDSVDVELKKLKAQGANGAKAFEIVGKKLINEKLEKAGEVSEFMKGEKSRTSNILLGFDNPMQMKAAGTMTFGASTTGQVVDNVYLPGIRGDVRRQMRIRELFNVGSMAGDKVPFLKQTGKDGTVTTVAEGATKPLTDKDISLIEASARKIATHLKMSEELRNDLPLIVSFITNQATNDILDVEDNQLLYGNGSAPNLEGVTATTNVLTASDITLTGVTNVQLYDAIVAAKGALAANEFMADTILLNPAQYDQLLTTKDADGQYITPPGVFFDGSVMRINGLPVFKSTAVTVGDLIVGEFMKGAQIFQREGMSVRFYDQDEDNAQKNLITVVLEERLALPIFYDKAFYFDTVADTKAAIS